MDTIDYFRSEIMSLIQIYIPSEIGHSSVSVLGELGVVQFLDLNPELNQFQRPYTVRIKKLDDLTKRLEYLVKEAEQLDIPLQPCEGYVRLVSSNEIDEIGARVEEFDERMRNMGASYDQLLKKHVELNEYKQVLGKSLQFFGGIDKPAHERVGSPGPRRTDLETGTMESAISGHLGFLCGTVARHKAMALESILWRALRGNLYMTNMELEEPVMDPKTLECVHKNVFVVSAHGKHALNKIRKIAESLGACFHTVASDAKTLESDLFQVEAQIRDVSSILFNTKQAKMNEMIQIADSLDRWGVSLRCEKSVYHVLNKCRYDANKKCLIAEGWTPRSSIPRITDSLSKASIQTNSDVSAVLSELPTKMMPPTYNKTIKLTATIQNIVDSYGVARYRELNPALFSLVTFPFMFGIMFGDFGHGALITVFALWMILDEKRLNRDMGELGGMVFGGRYLMLLMGIFSMYVGLIYNDAFSKSIHSFRSGFEFNSTGFSVPAEDGAGGNVVYPFGVDSAWYGTENAILFLNSYKMKQAIILGIIQMMFGTILSSLNYIYFEDFYSLVGVFVPQILFMASIVGYLGFLIVSKWITQTPLSPSILDTLINMFLSPGVVDPKDKLYVGQEYVQMGLLLIALVCVPWMLFFKPVMLMKKNRKQGLPVTGQEEEFNALEEFVHSGIHTIEFVLGSVSNTASYLRLWALSLAHSQLSDVLWEMIAEKAHTGPVMAVAMFALWFVLTLMGLVAMEGLSAFLHALRLHWVEFNSKFYLGTGYKFRPFGFKGSSKSSQEF